MKNVLSVELRVECIEAALYGRDHLVVPIIDIFDPKNYAMHVRLAFASVGVSLDDCVLVGDNPFTFDCFENTCMAMHRIDGLVGFRASDVREEILSKGNSHWLACRLREEELRLIADSQMRLHELYELRSDKKLK